MMLSKSPRPFPIPNPQRLLERKRVTLISAFRCQQGVVVSADSQETVGEHRVTVKKISPPLNVGNYQIAIAGGGNATLIEAFIIQLTRTLAVDASLSSIAEFRAFTEERLIEFHQNDVKLYRGKPKRFRLFIAAVCSATHEFEVWTTEGVRLRPIASDRPELIGIDYPLYAQTAQRLYRESMSMPQAVLASMYLLTLAEKTSNWVRGPMIVAKITEHGIHVESEVYVREAEDQLSKYEKAVTALFLNCADTSVSHAELEKSLEEFSRTAVNLHLHHKGVKVTQVALEVVIKRLTSGM